MITDIALLIKYFSDSGSNLGMRAIIFRQKSCLCLMIVYPKIKPLKN